MYEYRTYRLDLETPFMMRQNLRQWTVIASLLMLLMVAVPSPVFGYIDPGSGAFVYQAIYAAILGGIFYFRKLLSRLFKSGK
jgi:hypothetical protein